MDLEPQGCLRIDGKDLEYRWLSAGDPGKPVLLLLHEGLGSVAMWKDFPDRLAAQTGCNVFVYSRAGYGRSDAVSLPRPLDYMHHEGLTVLPELLEVLAMDRLILVGHSDGASIALIQAGGVADPRVKGLVLMAPHVFTEQICIDSIRDAKTAWEQGDLHERLGRYHQNVDVAFRGWNDAWLDPGFLDWNIEEYLPTITVPALIIQGEDDEYGTLAQVEAIRNQINAASEFCLLPQCGHSPHKDQQESTLAAIREFLKGTMFMEQAG